MQVRVARRYFDRSAFRSSAGFTETTARARPSCYTEARGSFERDPIGKKITLGWGRPWPRRREVVGIIGDVKDAGLTSRPAADLPAVPAVAGQSMTVVIKTSVPPTSLAERPRR